MIKQGYFNVTAVITMILDRLIAVQLRRITTYSLTHQAMKQTKRHIQQDI